MDHVALNLPDYLDIIKTPMDLGTVEENFQNNAFEKIEDLLSQVQLIWDNCKLYNLPGSVMLSISGFIKSEMILNAFL